MSSHTCPAPGCPVQVPDSMLACRTHWFSLAKPLRDAVWAAYNGPGVGSPEHRAAIDACIAALRSVGGAEQPEPPAAERDDEMQRRDHARGTELQRIADQIEQLPELTHAQIVSGLRDRAEWWFAQAARRV
jgi:hypothetical protein